MDSVILYYIIYNIFKQPIVGRDVPFGHVQNTVKLETYTACPKKKKSHTH